jgi:RNA polymerase sigma-70 factor (ECF subfamily)
MDLSIVPPEPSGSGGSPPPASAEATLLRRCAGSDREAFSELYDLVSPRVHGLVRRVVRNPAMSDEVTQEVMVEVWRHSARFDPAKGSAIGWILAIAHRRAVDRVRAEEATGRRDDDWARQSQPVAHDQTTERAERSIDRQRVRRALEQLTDTQRRSIELAYYGGYTHTEVAALLDIPVGTAKTRIRDGLIRLRDTLGGTR